MCEVRIPVNQRGGTATRDGRISQGLRSDLTHVAFWRIRGVRRRGPVGKLTNMRIVSCRGRR